VVKRILYRVLKKLVSISFNILNFCLGGNLPPLGCISVIVEDQGRYLLIQRPEGGLVFPSGFMRWREHPKQTAEREFMEETGLQVDLRHVVGCYSNVSSSIDSMSTLTLVYCGEVKGGEMRSSVEGRPCWIEEAELLRSVDFRYESMFDDYREHLKRHAELKSVDLNAQGTMAYRQGEGEVGRSL
jgi:ADP-ribose pyrophosphatase YjhB (NUDIX family)